ncbi:MAG: hypothetical protein MUC28_01515 [Planctomycetes bacterium]|nr:hypothetical protein [Planctomycetota bacterium]
MKPDIGDQPKIIPEKRGKKIRLIRILLAVVICMPFFMYLISTSPKVDAGAKASAPVIFIAALICAAAFLLFIWLLRLIFLAIGRSFKFIFRRPVYGIIGFVLVFIVGAAAVYLLAGRTYNSEITLSYIQQDLVELAAIKLAANSYPVTGKPDAKWEEAASSTRIKNNNIMAVYAPAVFTDYRLAAVNWARGLLGSANTGDWKKIPDQPGDFNFAISDKQAAQWLAGSVKKISDLKTAGDTAIKDKDRDAMRQVAAGLLVEKHWLNGILHSTEDSLAYKLAIPVLAESHNFSGLPGAPDVGLGCPVDIEATKKAGHVVCLAPGAGQETAGEKKPVAPGEDRNKTKLLPEIFTKEKNYQLTAEDITSYAPQTYTANIRKVCFNAYDGRNVCIPEVIEATTAVYDPALSYASGQAVSAANWDRVWETADEIAAIAPGMPSAEGGHEIPSDGVISQGEPDAAPPTPASPRPTANTVPAAKTPAPVTALAKTTEVNWDGRYFSPTFRWQTITCTGYVTSANRYDAGGFALMVENGQVSEGSPAKGYTYAAINAGGFASLQYTIDSYSYTDTYQFYRKDGKRYVDAKSVERFIEKEDGNENLAETVCTRTATASAP